MREERVRGLVLSVLEEALRRTGAGGAVVAGGGPEGTLLERWLSHGGISSFSPSPEAVALAQEVLLATDAGSGPGNGGMGPRALASMALARRQDLLLLGTATRTLILLSRTLPPEPILPLGDIFASEVLDIQGECTVPPILGGAGAEVVRTVDQGLQEWVTEAIAPECAFSAVDPALRPILVDALREAKRRWVFPYLVPPLRSPTLGIDLDL